MICGSEARLDVLGGAAAHAARAATTATRLYGYRAARLVAGRDGVPSLGLEPGEATDALLLAGDLGSEPAAARAHTGAWRRRA